MVRWLSCAIPGTFSRHGAQQLRCGRDFNLRLAVSVSRRAASALERGGGACAPRPHQPDAAGPPPWRSRAVDRELAWAICRAHNVELDTRCDVTVRASPTTKSHDEDEGRSTKSLHRLRMILRASITQRIVFACLRHRSSPVCLFAVSAR